MKLVTVIIPVYNTEDYLEECLNSIINQTYRHLQILLVDDGSTDSSGEICDKYAQQDNRISVFHVENGGVSKARNMGLDNAKGEYIFFADSDDVYVENAIETFLQCAEKNNADLVIGDYYIMDSTGKSLTDPHEMERIIGKEKEKCISGETFWNNVTKCNIVVMPPSKLYKNTIWQKNRFKEGMICEDHYALPDIMACIEKIVCINFKTFYYRIHNSSIMHQGVRFKSLDAIVAQNREIDYLLEQGINRPCIDICLNSMRLMGKVKRKVKMNSSERKLFKERYRELCKVIRKLNKYGDLRYRIRTFVFRNSFPLYVILNGKSS